MLSASLCVCCCSLHRHSVNIWQFIRHRIQKITIKEQEQQQQQQQQPFYGSLIQDNPCNQDHSHALQACMSPAPRNWRGVQVVQDIGYLTKDANLILVSRQGFGEHKTEQLGGHSQEQQCHRQAPIDCLIDNPGKPVTEAIGHINPRYHHYHPQYLNQSSAFTIA